MADTQTASEGVQELISRLRDEGVQAGRQEADRVLKEAQGQAAQIVDQAKRRADEIRSKARAEIEAEHAAAIEALHVAARDTQLRLREMVRSTFAAYVKRLVSQELHDRDLLRQMILDIAANVAPRIKDGQRVDLLVSDELLAAGDEKGVDLTEKGKEWVHQFVLGASGDMLREGIEIKPSGDKSAGIRIRLVGEDLEIDLSDSAISDLLLKHLIPRYRTILLGIE